MGANGGITVSAEGVTETLKAFQALEADLARPAANAQLREAAGESADGLQGELVRSARSSGVPVAGRVASTIRVKRDRIPAVEIGGSAPVGRYGAPASELLWGSEHGGHNFGVGRGPGYWIAPAVKRYGEGPALAIYRRAVADLIHDSGLD